MLPEAGKEKKKSDSNFKRIIIEIHVATTLSAQSCFLLSVLRGKKYLEISVYFSFACLYTSTIHPHNHKNTAIFVLLLWTDEVLNRSTATFFLYSTSISTFDFHCMDMLQSVHFFILDHLKFFWSCTALRNVAVCVCRAVLLSFSKGDPLLWNFLVTECVHLQMC